MSRLKDRDGAIASTLKESGSCVAVASLQGKGRALVATRDIPAGTTVMLESPVACVPLPGHSHLEERCATCLTSHLSVSTPSSSRSLQGPLSNTCSSPQTACQCSKSPSSLNPNPLMEKFISWAHLNCPTTALALGGVLALQATSSGVNPATLAQQYDQAPWTEIVIDPEVDSAGSDSDSEGDGDNDDGSDSDREGNESLFRQHCRELCREAYELLCLEDTGTTLDEWDRIIGVVEKNAGFIHPHSPYRDALEANITRAVAGKQLDAEAFEQYAAAVEEQASGWWSEWGEGEGDEDEYIEEIEEIEEDEEDSDEAEEEGDKGNEEQEEDGSLAVSADCDDALIGPIGSLVRCFNLLPAPEYSGLFPAFAIMNHSCCPNVEIQYNHGDFRSSTVAVKDIQRGEEVCISYVVLEELPGVRRRRARLQQQHGFVCNCSRCEEEELEMQRIQKKEQRSGRGEKRHGEGLAGQGKKKHRP